MGVRAVPAANSEMLFEQSRRALVPAILLFEVFAAAQQILRNLGLQ